MSQYTDASQSTLKSATQGLLIFFAVQFLISQFVGSKASTSAPSSASSIPPFEAKPDGAVSDYNPIPQSIAPIWPMNSTLDIRIYVSPSLVMPALSHVSTDTLVMQEEGFTLGNWKDSRDVDTTFKVPSEVQHDGTLWAHIYVALHGQVLDPVSKDYNIATAYHFFRQLNHVLPKKKIVKTKKLLGGSNDTDDPVEDIPHSPKFASYYHPNFTMSFIPDSGTQSYVNMHPAVRQHVNLESTGARDSSGQNGWYYPILYVNTFWQLRDHMTELNSTVEVLPLHITLNNLNNWKFSLYASIDEGVKQNQKQVANGGPVPAGGDGSEFEEFKRVLIDTNIWLLSTTAFVTVLHMLFEALAFKSDIVGILCKSCH